MVTFTFWLRDHEDDSEAMGELSRDFAADLRRIRRAGGGFPKTPLDVLRRLLGSHSWPSPLKTLTQAVEEWHRENEFELQQLAAAGLKQTDRPAWEAARTVMADCDNQLEAYLSELNLSDRALGAEA